MNKKVGRPTVPKKQAKTVLLGAQLSQVEAREAQRAVDLSGLDKSKWLREAVKEKIEKQEASQFIADICKHLKTDQWPVEIEATIEADILPPSTGLFSFGSKPDGMGVFRPIGKDNVNQYPSHGAKLILSGIVEPLLVKKIQRHVGFFLPAYFLWLDVNPE